MNKQIKIMSVVFILLGIIVFVLSGNSVKKEESGTVKKRFFEFTQAQIQSFQINDFTQGLLFKKKEDGEWLVKRVPTELTRQLEEQADAKTEEFDKEFKPADAVKVAQALTHLMELKNLEPVATKAVEPGVYQINPHTLHMIFFDGSEKELGRIFVGKQGPDPFTSFIKKGDSDFVYLADQDFRHLLGKKYKDWLKGGTDS